MSNPYFQFKQFIVWQDRCAMKVCTDACIFGAWLAGKDLPGSAVFGQPVNEPRVLDIGSGTGLLMLMLAQKHPGMIGGIELDAAACGQGQENVGGSVWKDRLEIVQGDARDHVFLSKFGLIITNPPFFEDDLPSASGAENLAKHSKELRLSELIAVIGTNLCDTGSFGILLPWRRAEYFEGLAAAEGFQLRDRLLVRQTPKHDFFRAMLYFSRTGGMGASSTNELTIKDAAGNYTEEFVGLMRDYYLYL